MTTTVSAAPGGSLRRAVLFMTATSFLVPAVGLVTAPLLARALSTDGRGELAAALAPAGLMLAVATLGLPDALTYAIAKRPTSTRSAIAWSSVVTLVLGLACVGLTWLFLPFLSTDDDDLGRLILLGAAATVPALVVNVLRGAAMGRQMWGAVAAERVVITGVKLVGLTVFFVAGGLTVMVAVVVNLVAPLVAGVAYWKLLRRPGDDDDADADPAVGRLGQLVSFGSRVWLGSVASMLLSRFGQIFMAPLSSVADLGIYTVASTVSDVPLMVALAVQGALFGVNSRSNDAGQLATTSRLTTLLGLAGCVVLGATLPWWIGLLFGAEFEVALVPSIMLLTSAVICIPGLMAASALAAWGRPGLRSLGLTATLVVNVTAFVLLVPRFGVYGACWTSILSNVALTTFMVVAASRLLHIPAHGFLLPRGSDIALARRELARLARRVFSRPGAGRDRAQDG